MYVLDGSADGDTQQHDWQSEGSLESAAQNGTEAEETNEVFHLRLQIATIPEATGRASRLPASSLPSRSSRSLAGVLTPRSPRLGFTYALDLSRREAAGMLRQLEEGRPVRIQGGVVVRPEQVAAVEVRSTVHPAAETLRMARLLQRAGLSLSRDSAGPENGSGLMPEVEMVFAAGRRRSGAELSQD